MMIFSCQNSVEKTCPLGSTVPRAAYAHEKPYLGGLFKAHSQEKHRLILSLCSTDIKDLKCPSTLHTKKNRTALPGVYPTSSK